MHLQRSMVRQALRLGLVVTLIVLALSSCGALGGGQEQANEPRPLPEYPKTCTQLRTMPISSSLPYYSVSAKDGPSNALRGPISYASPGEERIRSSPSLTSMISTSPAGVGQ